MVIRRKIVMKKQVKLNLEPKELEEYVPGATRKQVLEALEYVIQAKPKKATKTSTEPPVPA